MRRAGLAVLLLALAGCGGEEAPEAAAVDFVVMEEEVDPADVAPPMADEEPADDVDAVEPPEEVDEPDLELDEPDFLPDDDEAMPWDVWYDECVADGEDPEECRCVVDLLEDISGLDAVSDFGLDMLLEEAFEERPDELFDCFGGAIADD